MPEVFKLYTEKVLSQGEKCRKIEELEIVGAYEFPKEYESGYPAVCIDPDESPQLTLCVAGDIEECIWKMHIVKGRYRDRNGIHVNTLRVFEGEVIPEEEFQVFMLHLADAVTRLREINERVAQRSETWKGKEMFVVF